MAAFSAMRAMRSAAALLRGAAGLALMSHHVLPAGAGALAAAELARQLGQGCAARHAATAAGDDDSGRGPPRKRAPHPGKRGEKTADGKPKPDERTVADLVRRCWFKSEEAAVALLTRKKSRSERFPFETAESTADWLEATLGPEPVKDGLCPAAKAVKGDPTLLYQDATTLQRKWDALTLSPERGGVGIAFSTGQAREVVRKYPRLLGYSVEPYTAGWSMLTAAENGRGLSPEEARKCILCGPALLLKDNKAVVKRAELVESLGYAGALALLLKQPSVLNFKEERVKESDAWLKQSGLDHVKLVTIQPTLLGGASVRKLQTRLDFLRLVAGMSTENLNNAPWLFGLHLGGRVRPCFFYALQKDRLGRRHGINTLMVATDAVFVAMMQGGSSRDRASKAEVARYQKLVTSAKFVAWRERQEARLMRRAP